MNICYEGMAIQYYVYEHKTVGSRITLRSFTLVLHFFTLCQRILLHGSVANLYAFIHF